MTTQNATAGQAVWRRRPSHVWDEPDENGERGHSPVCWCRDGAASTQYGVRLDCGRNACDTPCVDDGRIFDVQATPIGDSVRAINGHTATLVERTIGPWLPS